MLLFVADYYLQHVIICSMLLFIACYYLYHIIICSLLLFVAHYYFLHYYFLHVIFYKLISHMLLFLHIIQYIIKTIYRSFFCQRHKTWIPCHYLSCIIIFHTSLFLILFYFSCDTISHSLIFLAKGFRSMYTLDAYTLFFLASNYFSNFIIFNAVTIFHQRLVSRRMIDTSILTFTCYLVHPVGYTVREYALHCIAMGSMFLTNPLRYFLYIIISRMLLFLDKAYTLLFIVSFFIH